MSDLDKLKVIVHDLDAIIACCPELKRRLAEIEARDEAEEKAQLADEAEMAWEAQREFEYKHRD